MALVGRWKSLGSRLWPPQPFSFDGVVAQLVERLVRNEKVRGSIPLGSTILL
jgi:hypothetical protein